MQKGKLTIGADVAIAAGPVGRQAEADTDARLKAEIVSYSRSRGLFAGVSLEGAALLLDMPATEAYYPHEAGAILDPRTGQLVPVAPLSVQLQWKIAQLTAAPVSGEAVPVCPPMRMQPPLPSPH
jgi:lipid-binding SYLF domain-containing protein